MSSLLKLRILLLSFIFYTCSSIDSSVNSTTRSGGYFNQGNGHGYNGNHIDYDDYYYDDYYNNDDVNNLPENGGGVAWSTAEECARQCQDGEQPRNCYYHLVIEYYATMNMICNLCRSNLTNQLTNKPKCECVEADGFERSILSINRMLPGPFIQVCKGDKLVIDVENKAEGLEVSLHWHGIFQNGYQYYDGTPYVTQCPILSGTTFRYQFVAANSGTHFYHSHLSLHMLDGQYGALIVRDPPQSNPHFGSYDEDRLDHVIVISDWMYELSIERFPGRVHQNVGQSANNILINGKGKHIYKGNEKAADIDYYTVDVDPGKKYRIRLINSQSTVCLTQMVIQNHNMTIIAQDGENVMPVTVDAIISGTGERVDFILNTNQKAGSYWIQVIALGECAVNEVMQLAVLKYSGVGSAPLSAKPGYTDVLPHSIIYNPINVTLCESGLDKRQVCINQLKSVDDEDQYLLTARPDIRIPLSFRFWSYNSTLNIIYGNNSYAPYFSADPPEVLMSVVNDIIYSEPPSPPLSQYVDPNLMCNPWMNFDKCSGTPCTCTHTYHVKLGSIVELIVYDTEPQPNLHHPFHLHGYSFKVLSMGQLPVPANITVYDIDRIIKAHDARLKNQQYSRSPGKDTLIVPLSGWTIVRFVANNPGWWLYHCHFTLHTASGMNVVIHVGQPRDLPPVPNNFPTCSSWTPSVNL